MHRKSREKPHPAYLPFRISAMQAVATGQRAASGKMGAVPAACFSAPALPHF